MSGAHSPLKRGGGRENRPMRLSADTVSTGVSSLDFCNHPTVHHWQLKTVWVQQKAYRGSNV